MNPQQREQLERSIQDPVKMTVFVDPHTIDCGHTFDKDTLDGIWTTKAQSREGARCPTCRASFSPTTMKPNYAMRDTVKCTQLLLAQIDQISQLRVLQHEEHKSPASAHGSRSLVIDYVPEIEVFTHKNRTCIRVSSPDGQKECSADLVICIDVSGSMSEGVIRKDDHGTEIDDGLSTLDIVKHAALALIKGMRPTDRVGITTFSTSSEVVMPMTIMSESAKAEAERMIKSLDANGCTHLWAGIEKSLDLCREVPRDTNRTTSICLLTDGVPTASYAPTVGYKNALKRYQDRYPTFNCTLNVIGFGYNLDSPLLDELSQQMNGSYCFVPDGTMVGTIFTHLGANLAVSVGTNTTLQIDFEDAKDLQEVLDNKETDIDTCYGWTRSNRTLSVNLGNICYGQDRTIVIPTPSSGLGAVAIRFTNTQSHKNENIILDHVDSSSLIDTGDQSKIDVLKAQMFRQILVSSIRRSLNYMACGDELAVKAIMSQSYGLMQKFGIRNGSECADIAKDLTGQVSEAFTSKQAFARWGKHYVPSLARAHSLQQCNNFRDPGVQHLGGELFKQCRDTIDGLFNTLPDPTPSRYVSGNNGYTASANYTPGHTMMSSYNTSSGPCFRGDCLVKLADGSLMRVDQIRGKQLISPYQGPRPDGTPVCDDTVYEVLAVIKTKCIAGTATFVNYKGLIVTPTHPVISICDERTEWCRPIDLVGDCFVEACEFVYNFVLANGHIININGVDCVTLGHGFVGNFHIEHPFFGTHKLIDDVNGSGIMKLASDGVITLEGDCLTRDPQTGWVTGFNTDKIIYDSKANFNQNTGSR